MASDDDVRKELDARIRCLELELSDLKQRRNTLSPISRLPPEIFCKLFVYSLPELDYQKQHGGRRRLHAMELSHVSHTWRAVALECAELWAHLQVGVHTREEMLAFAHEKARHVPISVSLCGLAYGPDSPDDQVPSDRVISTLTKIVREGSARCHSLQLWTGHATLERLLHGHVGGFDTLVTLKLVTQVPDWTVVSPLPCFSGCPRVRRVEVGGALVVPLSWAPLRSPFLTHVHLERVWWTGGIVTDILAIMNRSTNLQSFAIENTRTSTLSNDDRLASTQGGTGTLPLSKLKWLELGGISPTDLISLLSSISVPVEARLDLRTYAQECKELMSSVGRVYSTPSSPAVLLIAGEQVCTWDLAELACDYRQEGHRAHAHLHRSVLNPSVYRIWEWGWSFDRLEILNLFLSVSYCGTGPRLSDEFWPFLASNSPSIKKLKICTFCACGIVPEQLLGHLHARMDSHGGVSTAWPLLEVLHLPLPLPDSDCCGRYGQSEGKFVQDLADSLNSRRRVGIQPVAAVELPLYGDGEWEEKIEMIMAGAVGKVTWITRVEQYNH